MRKFWRELEDELKQTSNISDRGFTDLADCSGVLSVMSSESSTEVDAQTAALIRKIQTMQNEPQQEKKAEDIVKLLRTEQSLNLQDWPELIRAFGGREAFIQRYFPQSVKSRSRS